MSEMGYITALLGGVLSFLSPCVLPLIPSYVSFITGISFEDFKTGDRARIRKLTIINSSAFVLGFSTVFILLGVSSTYIGKFFAVYYDQIRIIGGIIIILFGLYVMGVLKLNFLASDRRIHLRSKPRGHFGAFIVGLTFGAGWTPCIGPILGSILLIASTTGSAMQGFKLLVVYSAGLAIPFVTTALLINTFLSHFSAIQKYMRLIMILSGLLLIGFGIILLTDNVPLLLGMAPDLGVEELVAP
ncbi:MAG TPA: cytochrome c biogenesis protein CcdA [Nitrospirae bacterium]|nr:thiol:disulfide interchange protein precursor [bacterium BMS3Abin06]HDH13364.1 cytochrome c biogenesis protein CcdA [Nitrospirota bacterium]HDZ00732.1 cytochrome c biogenesis protein CcdA [Nitrospirota bacterium]